MTSIAAVQFGMFPETLMWRKERERTAPDEELVGKCLAGEEDAFRTLYERYRRPVFSTVCRILHNSEEAQDAMQEIFIKVYRFLPCWDPGKAKFSTWLYRLASNHAIDCWRARCRRAERRLETECGVGETRRLMRLPADSPVFHPYSTLESSEKAAEIRRCVDALPRLQRTVFVRRHIQGLKLREIAEAEGYSLATVKSSLYRATRFLRNRLRQWRRGRGAEALPCGAAAS
jgi:RNA polymerase sigma-70 factor (ECF subfamily)